MTSAEELPAAPDNQVTNLGWPQEHQLTECTIRSTEDSSKLTLMRRVADEVSLPVNGIQATMQSAGYDRQSRVVSTLSCLIELSVPLVSPTIPTEHFGMGIG